MWVQLLRSGYQNRRCIQILPFYFIIFFCLISTAVDGQDEQPAITITDEYNEPLPGVSVFDLDLRHAFITNDKGKVKLPADPELIWVFSHVGYPKVQFTLEELKKAEYKLQFLPQTSDLEILEVVGRMTLRETSRAVRIETIKREQIAKTNAPTSAAAIEQHAGVFVQRSQMGGGSPIVRGFEANRVLLVVDGVRMNNAIYRSGHLQNSITIDVDALESLDVIYGPGSLLYGSDALGGVIHFRTIKPTFASGIESLLIKGKGYARYSSAASERSGHVNFQIGGKKLSSFTALSFNQFGDLRTGTRRDPRYPDFGKRLYYAEFRNKTDISVPNPNPNLQVGTGYSQTDLTQKVRWKPTEHLEFNLNLQLSSSSDIPRYDALNETNTTNAADLRYARWDYGPQYRTMAALQMDLTRSNLLFDKAVVILSGQQVQEERIERRFGNPILQNQLETVGIGASTFDFQKRLPGYRGWSIMYGADYQYNEVSSAASGRHIITNESVEVFTRYPSDGSNMQTWSAYTHLHAPLGDGMTLQAGVRYAYNQIWGKYEESALFNWPDFLLQGFKSNHGAVSGSVSLLKQFNEGWTVSAQLSNAFRAANIDDIAKTRVRREDIIIPNVELGPEYAYTAEIQLGRSNNLRKPQGKLKYSYTFNIGGFYTRLENAVVQSRFTLPNGDSIFIQNGTPFRVFSQINAETGNIYGVTFDQEVWWGRWHVRQQLAYTRGLAYLEEGDVQPMAHIPPLYGMISISYHRKSWSVMLNQRFNAAKPADQFAPVSSDNLELATPIGSLPWWIFNLYGEYQFMPQLKLQLGIENILDLHYRTFSSGISAPGRNFIVTARFTL
jgi:hemoglobin/transferrin/lactoferrin receptor protein